MISVLSAMPSQWALQYFCFSGATQLQAGFAHFLVLAILTSETGPAWVPEATQAWVTVMRREVKGMPRNVKGGAPR